MNCMASSCIVSHCTVLHRLASGYIVGLSLVQWRDDTSNMNTRDGWQELCVLNDIRSEETTVTQPPQPAPPAALHSWPCHTEELNLRTEPCSRAARETWRVGIARRATQQNCFGNGHRPRKRDDEKKHFNDKLLRTEIVLGSAEKTVHAKSIHHSTKMRSETPRSTTGTPSSGPADRNAHRCDKHTRRAQVSTDHTDKSSTLGVEKMRTRKCSPSNEDAFRNTMLYYWYLLQWSGRSQGTPLWYACKARPGADKPRGQLRHAGDPPSSFSHRSIQSSGR